MKRNFGMKKNMLAALVFFCMAVVMTGCSGVAQIAPTPAPTAQYMPQNAVVPDSAANSAVEKNSARFDWTNESPAVEERIDRISEIESSRVITNGDTALVGVRFAREYRGELTERIREMIAKEVMAADPGIKTVAVTAQEDDVEDIFELSDEIRRGDIIDDLAEEIREIVREVTTLR